MYNCPTFGVQFTSPTWGYRQRNRIAVLAGIWGLAEARRGNKLLMRGPYKRQKRVEIEAAASITLNAFAKIDLT